MEYRPLATAQDMRDGPYRYALQGATDTYLDSTMARASRRIESRCGGRRFVPFEGAIQTEIAEGVAQSSEFASPLGYPDPIRMSLANALVVGSGGTVRDFWLDDHAPVHSELWTYSAVSVHITPPYGGGGTTVAPTSGPAPDSGHFVLPLGVYCPVGSTVATYYSGGYTVAYPEDLVEAALLQATKFLILGMAPEQRGNLTTKGLDEEITAILVPYGAADPRRELRRGGR